MQYILKKHAASLYTSCKYSFVRQQMQHPTVKHAILLCIICIICNIAPSYINDKQLHNIKQQEKKCNTYWTNMQFHNTQLANLKRKIESIYHAHIFFIIRLRCFFAIRTSKISIKPPPDLQFPSFCFQLQLHIIKGKTLVQSLATKQ